MIIEHLSRSTLKLCRKFFEFDKKYYANLFYIL